MDAIPSNSTPFTCELPLWVLANEEGAIFTLRLTETEECGLFFSNAELARTAVNESPNLSGISIHAIDDIEDFERIVNVMESMGFTRAAVDFWFKCQKGVFVELQDMVQSLNAMMEKAN